MTTRALDSYTTRSATTSLRLALRKTGTSRREAIAEHFKRFPPRIAATCPMKPSRSMSN